MDVVPGQAPDAPLRAPRLDATPARVPEAEELVGDPGFDGAAQRFAGRGRGVAPNVPTKSTRADPWPFDPDGYRGRNRVERLFAKAKPFRRSATRYEELRVRGLGVVHLVLGVLRLRRLSNVNTA